MAVPKGKHSKARSRKRRTNWNCATPQVGICAQCSQNYPTEHVTTVGTIRDVPSFQLRQVKLFRV